MRFDADYVRSIPVYWEIPEQLAELKRELESSGFRLEPARLQTARLQTARLQTARLQTASDALPLVSAEYRRVYERSEVNWDAWFDSEFEQLVDRGLDARERTRQFAQHLDLNLINLTRRKVALLAIERGLCN